MKSLFTLVLLLCCGAILAQTPNAINYQAALRNNTGQPMVSQNVTVRFGIYSGPGAATKVFEETHSLTTTALGIINCVIGNGTATFGTLSDVQWGNNQFHLKVEVNSGSGYNDMGTQQLISVPYSLYSGKSASADIANGISSNVKIPTSQLSGTGAATGQVLKWKDTAWIPGTIDSSSWGDITDVLTGAGLSGGGTTGSVTISADTANPLWNANKIQSVNVNTTSPAIGQVLKYNGTTWGPADEAVDTINFQKSLDSIAAAHFNDTPSLAKVIARGNTSTKGFIVSGNSVLGNDTAYTNAVLNINHGTNKGVMWSAQMTEAQMLAIPNPTDGLEVYCTTYRQKFIFNGVQWMPQ